MGAGGRAVILFIARLAWVAMLAVTAGLTWLIWSVASEEAAIRAASLPAEGRILAKREEIRRGSSAGGRFRAPDITSWEVEALVVNGPPEPESAQRQQTQGEVRASLSESAAAANEAIAKANRAIEKALADLDRETGSAAGGFTLPPLPGANDDETAPAGDGLAPHQAPASAETAAPDEPAAASTPGRYLIEFETNIDPGEVGDAVALLIYPPDVAKSSTADLLGRWNRSLIPALAGGAGLALLMMFLIFFARALFGRAPRSVGRRG